MISHLLYEIFAYIENSINFFYFHLSLPPTNFAWTFRSLAAVWPLPQQGPHHNLFNSMLNLVFSKSRCNNSSSRLPSLQSFLQHQVRHLVEQECRLPNNYLLPTHRWALPAAFNSRAAAFNSRKAASNSSQCQASPRHNNRKVSPPSKFSWVVLRYLRK